MTYMEAWGKQKMATFMRLALWFFAGMLAGLALLKFALLGFDAEGDDDSETEGDD